MSFNRLISSLMVLVVVFTCKVPGQEKPEAVDYSAMWNAAHRVLLGLDQASPAQGVQDVNAEATMNPLSPSNNPDIQVFNPCLYWQSENSIGVNFSDPNQLMVSTNGQIPITPTVVQQTWAFSTDNGVTWPSSLQSENIPPPIINCLGDPVAFFDRSGRAYYSTIGASGTSSAGMFFVSTTDFGATWSARSNADPNSSSGDDKQHAAADFSGTFPNNVYCAWTDFNVSGSPVIFNRSTNQGQTWLARQTLQIGSNRGQGVHIGIGPNGEVYVMWAHYTTGTAEAGIGMAKSTDGGATFSTPAIVFPINGIRISNGAIAALNGTRAASFPYFDVDRSNGPRRGWMYAAIPELDVPTTGQADIYLHRSSNGGTTWDTPIRINGPDVQAGKWQFMASIAVDPSTGGITVSYYSMDSTGTNYMTNRYAAYSIDGGTTWDNWVISDVRALWAVQGTPNTNSTYNGDYYETAAMGGKAWALWTDRRSGSSGSFNKAYIERIIYAENFGWVKGTITNASGGAQLPGVAVDFTDPILQQGGTSNATGFYVAGAQVDTPATTRNVTLRARKFGFLDTLLNITITRNDTLTRNFAMRPLDLVLTKSSITFPPTPVPGMKRDSLIARNQSATPLTLSSVTTTNPDFAASPASGVIPANDSMKIYVTYTPSAEGSDTGRVIVLSNSIFTPRKDVLLGGTAIGVPHFTASVDSLTRTLEGGVRDSVVFRMRNVGTTAGNFSARAIMYPRTLAPEQSASPIIMPMILSPVNTPVAGDDPFSAMGANPTTGHSSLLVPPPYFNFDSTQGGNSFPFNVAAGKRVQWLVGAGELNRPSPAPAGRISEIYFRTANTTAQSPTFSNVTIMLGQTSLTSLPTGVVYTGSLTAVYFRASLIVPAPVTDWIKFDLDTPFAYDPSLSLIIDVQQCGMAGTGFTVAQRTFAPAPRRTYLTSAACPQVYSGQDGNAVGFGVNISGGIWLSVAPQTGTIAMGDSVLMQAKFDASDSAVYNNPGNYYGRIEISATNSSLADTLRVPARLFVIPPPGARIIVDRDSLDFGDVEIDSSKTLSVLVRNIGAASLNVTGITMTNTNFSAIPSSFTLASLDTQRINVRFTAPSPGATQLGTMQFVSNDPLAPAVRLRGRSVGVAHVVVHPDSFRFMISQGDSVDGRLTIRNTGLGELTYTSRVNGGFVGQDSANVGNSSSNAATASGLMRGGVVQVTTSVQLNEIKSWLIITASREMRWVVYENTTGTSFTKIFESTTTSGTGGPQWFSSGPVNVTLEAGKRYAIGVDWAALSGLTYYWQASAPVPVPIPFGTLTGGLSQTVFPPPATLTQGALTSLFYTQLVTSSSRWLNVLSGSGGTVASGDSASLNFRVYTSLLSSGNNQASIAVLNNDPLAPIVTVPVLVDVITGISSSGPQIPLTYELSQNYPNPFNPTTRIEFALPEESLVRLTIYNILGQEIATLTNEQRPAGYFAAEWNGANSFGNKVSSGVYFYKMEATSISGERSFSSLRKMLILK